MSVAQPADKPRLRWTGATTIGRVRKSTRLVHSIGDCPRGCPEPEGPRAVIRTATRRAPANPQNLQGTLIHPPEVRQLERCFEVTSSVRSRGFNGLDDAGVLIFAEFVITILSYFYMVKIGNCSPPIKAPKTQQQFQSQLLRQEASFTFGCDDLNRLLLILSLRLSFSASFVQSGSTSREIIA